MSDPPTTSPLPSDEVRRRPEPPLPEMIHYETKGGSPSFQRLKRMVTLLRTSADARVELYLILFVVLAFVITALRLD